MWLRELLQPGTRIPYALRQTRLARGQQCKLLLQLRQVRAVVAPIDVFSDRGGDRIEKILIPYRLGEKIDRPQLHASYRHGNVAKGGHQDHRDSDIDFRQVLLQLQATRAGQSDIEHQTRRGVRQFNLQEVRSRSVQGDLVVQGLEQVAKGLANRAVIVDDMNNAGGRHVYRLSDV